MSSHVGLHINQENGSTFAKTEMAVVQKMKQRTVLGVLTENEQHRRMPLVSIASVCLVFICIFTVLNRFRVSFSDSLFTLFSKGEQCSFPAACSVNAGLAGCDVYVEVQNVVVPASEEDMADADSSLLEENRDALQHRDFRLFLDLSTSEAAAAAAALGLNIASTVYSRFH